MGMLWLGEFGARMQRSVADLEIRQGRADFPVFVYLFWASDSGG